MTLHRNVSVWLLLSSLTLPLIGVPGLAAPPASGAHRFAADEAVFAPGAESDLLARAGGGRGGGGGRSAGRSGGGGNHGGGGGNRGGGRPQTGFQSAGGGLNRGSSRPSGGWSNKLGSDKARPSLDRPVAQRDGQRNLNRNGNRNGNLNRDLDRNGNRTVNRDIDRTVNRDIDRNVNRDINRDWKRTGNINDVNLYPGWARAGWGLARPWNTGWYGGWSTPSWGWWGARAAAWGIGTLATAAIINDAVDDAIDDQVSYIVVPNSNYQLLYGTVTPAGGSSVTFDVTDNGTSYRLTADCNAGTLNGRDPGSPAEAELLNAACQVAYGST